MKEKIRQFAAFLLFGALLAGTVVATGSVSGSETEETPDASASVVDELVEADPAGEEDIQQEGQEDEGQVDAEGSDEAEEFPEEEQPQLPEVQTPQRPEPLDEYSDLKIRVGLAYSGSNRGTLVEAKLLIAEGYDPGYHFGYYDEQLDFVPLAHAQERAVSVVKTTNVHLSGTDFKEGTDRADNTIGCYHLQLSGSLSSYEEAANLCQQFDGAFPAWIEGEYYVRAGSYTSSADAQAAAATYDDGTWTVCYTSVYGVNVVRSESTQILFQFDGGQEHSLAIHSGLSEWETYPCWFKGYKYKGGMRYERLDGGNITVVNILPLDDYLKGVVPYESVKIWPLETLKAQALCAKNYVLVNRNKHKGNGFDVCYTTDCQVYYGLGSGNESFQPSQLSDTAVDEIRGLYVWYGEDELAQTYFYSSNGGGSEDVSNVWGSKQENYPYLTGVVDPYEATVADQIPDYTFSSTWTNAQLTDILRSKGYATNTTVADFEVEYSKTGNVIGMKFTYANGKSNTFKTNNTSWIRNKLGCRSIHFTVLGGGDVIPQECMVNEDIEVESLAGMYALSADGMAVALDTAVPYAITGSGQIVTTGASSTVPEGTYLINGAGWGHNIGYSQWGGYAMAKLGYTCQEIIEFYFTGATVGPKAE